MREIKLSVPSSETYSLVCSNVQFGKSIVYKTCLISKHIIKHVFLLHVVYQNTFDIKTQY